MVRWRNASTGDADAAFLDKHDLVVSKLVAMRPKDVAFADALLTTGLVEVEVLAERAQLLPQSVDPRSRARVQGWLARYA